MCIRRIWRLERRLPATLSVIEKLAGERKV
jgi:hypothetical protein